MASAAHRWLKSLRTLHLYTGVFSAPALLFLAFTGGLQSVNLHESTPGSDYKPPAWIVAMAHMHKKQSFEVPAKRAPPKVATGDGDAAPDIHAVTRTNDQPSPATPKRNPWPMKIFFVLVALSLFLSTLTGIYMGWRYTRHHRRYGATLLAGVVAPALLLLL